MISISTTSRIEDGPDEFQPGGRTPTVSTLTPIKHSKYWNDTDGMLLEVDDITEDEESLKMEDRESPDSKPNTVKSSAAFRYSELKAEEKSPFPRSMTEKTEATQNQYQRVKYSGSEIGTENRRENCMKLKQALNIREKWKYKPNLFVPNTVCEPAPHDKPILLNVERVQLPGKSNWEMKMVNCMHSVWQKIPGGRGHKNIICFRSLSEFLDDLQTIMKISNNGSAKTFCWKRLKFLEKRFEMHNMLNDCLERQESRNCPHRDFYNVRKVDNNVYHAACMNRKQLLRFIKSRFKQCPHALVMEKDGEHISLAEIVKILDIKPEELSIDTLDMTPEQVTFHRFDRFTARYNPLEMSKLRSIFLTTDNYMNGRFLAEITEEVFEDFDSSKYQNAEFSLSIRGMSNNEWDKLAMWVCQWNLQANHTKWLIQTPRIYPILLKADLINSFQEMIENIFRPLFEVTIDPSTHPELHLFLKLVVGFDCVGDDSIPDKKRKKYPEPSEWTTEENPPFVLYTYYLYGNLYVLNQLRQERGMNTFSWRPHAGVSGDIEHLAVSFMVADSISHGIALKRFTVLQYLYYLSQIGIAMSPLSNNLLFLEYQKNPFPLFFTRGLRVTLCTENPLMIHYTKEPLVEEYAVAAQLYKLSNIDMCEIARNSVLISGFSHATKCHWIGNNYTERGPKGNCIDKTNVPNIRILFREEMLQQEEDMLRGVPVTDSICNATSGIRNKLSGRRRSHPNLVPPPGGALEVQHIRKDLQKDEDLIVDDGVAQPKLIEPINNKKPSELWSILCTGAPSIAFGIMTGMILMKMSESLKLTSGKSG